MVHEHPTPSDWKNYRIGYESDPSFIQHIDDMATRDIPGVELFIVLLGRKERFQLIPQPVIGLDDCYLLRVVDGQVKPRGRSVASIRRAIADHMGLHPAMFYSFLKEWDYYTASIYRSSFTTRCRFGEKYCVRPSHLIPCLWNGEPLREVLPYRIPEVIRSPFS